MAGFDAVIFDLDGLVLDTEPTYRLAWERAAQEMGFALDDAFFAGLSGCQGSDVEAALLARVGSDFALPEFRRRSGEHWRSHVESHGIAVKAGAGRLLEHLRQSGLPFSLATNSRRQYAERCLHLAGLAGAFPLMVARDDVARGKPAPDVYLETARRLGLAPAACLVLEDSLPGLTAAYQAGMAPVLVTDCAATAQAGAALAWRILESLEDVPAMLPLLEST
jgi:HAD superfamily hydrolase (TIGR01509 family)